MQDCNGKDSLCMRTTGHLLHVYCRHTALDSEVTFEHTYVMSNCLLQVTAKEVEKLIKAFTNPEDLYSAGLHVGGTRFVYLRHNGEHAIYGRKGSDSGVCVCKTSQAVIIGYYEGGIQPGACNTVVEKLGDYLRNSGF